ncbi:uncharacterized protein A4U43_C04F26050 [Asparagus officinalis]|uniref:Uncharacterized protein n=1 Tax=Asparagus officinalis TaxID=4686 RepID=A0A5P1F3N9_ASPOF|nr:uncharacterized protein A4U43_C04F26050 [Asparagus officinalis]
MAKREARLLQPFVAGVDFDGQLHRPKPSLETSTSVEPKPSSFSPPQALIQNIADQSFARLPLPRSPFRSSLNPPPRPRAPSSRASASRRLRRRPSADSEGPSHPLPLRRSAWDFLQHLAGYIRALLSTLINPPFVALPLRLQTPVPGESYPAPYIRRRREKRKSSNKSVQGGGGGVRRRSKKGEPPRVSTPSQEQPTPPRRRLTPKTTEIPRRSPRRGATCASAGGDECRCRGMNRRQSEYGADRRRDRRSPRRSGAPRRADKISSTTTSSNKCTTFTSTSLEGRGSSAIHHRQLRPLREVSSATTRARPGHL